MKHLKQWLTLAAAAALALGLLTGCDWFGTEQPSDSVPPSSSQGQDNNATPPQRNHRWIMSPQRWMAESTRWVNPLTLPA